MANRVCVEDYWIEKEQLTAASATLNDLEEVLSN